MRRRRGHKPVYYYCPKCKQKKLRSSYVDDLSIVSKYGSCRKVWVCDNDKVASTEDGVTEFERCGAEISVPGRDAEPADYHNVLDRMASSTPQICTWILGANNKVHQKGLKSLFTGEHLDLVRLRDDSGVGIYVFFRCKTFENDEELSRLLSRPAAQHIGFRGTSVQMMFSGPRLALYHKTLDRCSWSGPVFPDKIESPELRKVLVSWAADLDKEFLKLVDTVKNESEVFVDQEAALKKQVHDLSGGKISVESYDHITGRIMISPLSGLSRDQVVAMAAALQNLAAIKSANTTASSAP